MTLSLSPVFVFVFFLASAPEELAANAFDKEEGRLKVAHIYNQVRIFLLNDFLQICSLLFSVTCISTDNSMSVAVAHAKYSFTVSLMEMPDSHLFSVGLIAVYEVTVAICSHESNCTWSRSWNIRILMLGSQWGVIRST